MRVLVAAIVALAALTTVVGADEAASPVLFKNQGNSEVRGINDHGDAIGFRNAPDAVGGEEERAFYFSKGKLTLLPFLDGYTYTHPAAVSNDGLVAGHVSKVMEGGFGDPGHLNIQAFVWNAKTGKIQGLGVLKGYERSMAHSITADGSMVTGVCGKAGMISPCIWKRNKAGDWEATGIPSAAHSPLMVTSGLNPSPNGKVLTGIEGVRPCYWTLEANGTWKQTVIEGDLFVPKAVNDLGVIVGFKRHKDESGDYRAVVWSKKDGLKTLDVLPGTDSSKALAINNEGLIVGTSEKNGPEGGPEAFRWDGKQMLPIGPKGVLLSTANAVNASGQVGGFTGKEDDDFVQASIWTVKK
jgi:probable HAF family extracellular repeat protein